MLESVIDRAGFADFLRRRRELLRPADVGLPDGRRRRTPGLRREEVAALAGVSSDYYSRLEQCRGSRPSEPVVSALARALRCDLDAGDHLFHLAGITPPTRRGGRHIPPGLLKLGDHLTDVPARICTDLHDVLWQNPLADTTFGCMLDDRGRAGNLVWQWFTESAWREWIPEDDWPHLSESSVRDLRATYARRAGDADVTSLVHGLLKRSDEFRGLWERHEVGARRFDRKRFRHPEVGLLHLMR